MIVALQPLGTAGGVGEVSDRKRRRWSPSTLAFSAVHESGRNVVGALSVE
jgi:hypothetical protein